MAHSYGPKERRMTSSTSKDCGIFVQLCWGRETLGRHEVIILYRSWLVCSFCPQDAVWNLHKRLREGVSAVEKWSDTVIVRTCLFRLAIQFPRPFNQIQESIPPSHSFIPWKEISSNLYAVVPMIHQGDDGHMGQTPDEATARLGSFLMHERQDQYDQSPSPPGDWSGNNAISLQEAFGARWTSLFGPYDRSEVNFETARYRMSIKRHHQCHKRQ
jgi:hypothetical protein